MRCLAMLACVGCGSSTSPSDDCKLVLGDLPHAPANVTARYPGDPIKVAETIERCVAPDGDDCERVAKVVTAIPEMMPGAKRPGGDYVASCRSSPPALRRCLMPSYALAHAAECKQAIDDVIAAPIEIKPKGRTTDAPEPVALSVLVDGSGIWLARTSSTRCFAPRRNGALDLDWLGTELSSMRDPDSTAIEIAAATTGVRYQEIIAVMDLAVQRGRIDAGLTDPAGLGVSFDGIDPATAAKHCDPSARPAAKAANEAAAKAATAPGIPKTASDGALSLPNARPANLDAPVVVITQTEISVVQGNDRRTVATVASVASGSGPVGPLERAMPANSTKGVAILQADQQTDMRVISRVVETLKHAGYDNVLFAVKPK